MSGLAEMASGTEEMVIGRQVFVVSQLTVGDFAALEEEANRRARKERKETLAEYSAILREAGVAGAELCKALDEKEKEPRTEDRKADLKQEAWAVEYLVWRALSRRRPGLTLEEVGGLVTFGEMEGLVRRLTGGESERKNLGAAEIAGTLIGE